MSDIKGIIGLTNIGNTCYGNATLQALRHQVDLTIFILQGNHTETLKDKPISEKTKLLESYGTLIRNMWMNEKGVQDTREFWGYMVPLAIKAGVEHLRMPVAHDAHEFLVFLLDQFHEALAEEVDMTIKSESTNVDTLNALQAWKKAFEKSYSPIVRLVFGLQRKAVCCSGCQNESVSWDTMNMVKVSVPKHSDSLLTTGCSALTLHDLIKKENEGEIIDEYNCEKCCSGSERKQAHIKHSLWRLGNWVIIVLKRNENNGRRINTQVEIPLTTSFTSVFHPDSKEPSAEDTYDLFATIHHHGSSGGGHYTAQAKHPVSHKWIHYDDESAREITEPHLDSSTYIVMYRKTV